MSAIASDYDVVVVGGGAAGLNGALMLARMRRSVLVVDAGRPRNAPAEAVHGLFARDGTPPAELLARGRAEVEGYGGQILIRQELWKGFFGWIAYTVSRSERKDHPDDPWRVFQYDQTHILTIIGSYKFGRGYQVGIRFRYVTGNPYTPTVGSYYDVNSDAYVPINGPLYSARLGSFNQLDVRFDKKWTFQRWAMSMYIDIQNIYRASNPEGYAYNFDFSQRSAIAGLPFLPVLGIRGDF